MIPNEQETQSNTVKKSLFSTQASSDNTSNNIHGSLLQVMSDNVPSLEKKLFESRKESTDNNDKNQTDDENESVLGVLSTKTIPNDEGEGLEGEKYLPITK